MEVVTLQDHKGFKPDSRIVELIKAVCREYNKMLMYIETGEEEEAVYAFDEMMKGVFFYHSELATVVWSPDEHTKYIEDVWLNIREKLAKDNKTAAECKEIADIILKKHISTKRWDGYRGIVLNFSANKEDRR